MPGPHHSSQGSRRASRPCRPLTTPLKGLAESPASRWLIRSQRRSAAAHIPLTGYSGGDDPLPSVARYCSYAEGDCVVRGSRPGHHGGRWSGGPSSAALLVTAATRGAMAVPKSRPVSHKGWDSARPSSAASLVTAPTRRAMGLFDSRPVSHRGGCSAPFGRSGLPLRTGRLRSSGSRSVSHGVGCSAPSGRSSLPLRAGDCGGSSSGSSMGWESSGRVNCSGEFIGP